MPETIFVWDPVNDCVISELDGSGAVQVTYTNEPQQYGGVISQRRGTTTSTYHADALGSTRALTNNSGNVTDTYLNDAWGVPVASTGTTVNPFRWVGKYGYFTDNSTAQVYVRARMYQPTVARWISADSLGFSDGINRFLYTRNALGFWIDPSGLVSIREVTQRFGNCGEYAWVTEWQLGADEQSGFVIQRVCVHEQKEKCPGSEMCEHTEPPLTCENRNKCKTPCYWELWPVHNGKYVVFNGRTGLVRMPSPAEGVTAVDGNLFDTFAETGCVNFKESCTKGQHRKTGEVLFVSTADMGEPVVNRFLRYFVNGPAGVASACNLLSTCDDSLRKPVDNSSPSGPPPNSGNEGTKGYAIYLFLQWYFSTNQRPSTFKDLRLLWDCCSDACGNSPCTGTNGIMEQEAKTY